MTKTVTGLTPGVVVTLVTMIFSMITRVDVESMLEEIEWGTLFFFGVVHSGKHV